MNENPSSSDYTPARLYSLIHRGNPGDATFYVRACRGAHRVLELGCGSGRILLALALAGYEVTGLDRDTEPLRLAAHGARALPPRYRDRVRLLRRDMRSFRLPHRFDRILIPYNGLYCLLDDDSVLACLSSVRQHLAPAGQLLFDVYQPSAPPDEPAAGTGPLQPLVQIVEGDASIDVYERDHFMPERQRVDATYEFHVRQGGTTRVVEQTVRQRYLYRAQLEDLLERASLRVSGVWGDFTGRHPSPDDDLIVVRAQP